MPTSRDQTPAVQMTVGVRMRPAEVSIVTILSPRTAIRSSDVPWRMVTPCVAATPAYACTTDSGEAWPSIGAVGGGQQVGGLERRVHRLDVVRGDQL